jgi:hypothetical protein
MSEIENQEIESVELPEQELPEVEVNEQPEVSEEAEEKAPEEAEEITFPKKAINAIERRDKKITKYKSELAELRRELDGLKNPPKEVSAPSEDDFETYGDYIKAIARHEAQQINKPTIQEVKPQEVDPYMQQRAQYASQKASEFIKTNPEYQQVYAENLDVFVDLPQQIQDAFLQVDNPPAAFYALAKEGKLEQLANVPLERAIFEIARAETRGSVAKKITNAPTPIQSTRGVGSQNKSIDNMSPDELVKRYIK